jgi:hypothetical protein
MASEAYERNFTGMANAIDTNARQSSEIIKTQRIADAQLQDMIARITLMEAQVQLLLARTMPRGSQA